MEKQKEENLSLKDDITKLNNNIASLSEANSKNDAYYEELILVKQENLFLDEERTNLMKNLEKVRSAQEQNVNFKEEYERKEKDYMSKISKLTSDNDSMSSQLQILTKVKEDFKAKSLEISSLNDEIVKLNNEITTLSSVQSKNNAYYEELILIKQEKLFLEEERTGLVNEIEILRSVKNQNACNKKEFDMK